MNGFAIQTGLKWKKEYIFELCSTHVQNGDCITNVEVGEVAVIHDKMKRDF